MNPQRVDAENPWPGLSPFEEDSAGFFGGREAECDELMRLVMQSPVSLVFGKSGLGKTSLLKAGLFSRLRRADLFPIYVRLDVRERSMPLVEQLALAMREAFAVHAVEAFAHEPGDGLWEQLHDLRAMWWSARNRALTPLFVLDQFEEVFTLGSENPAAVDALRLDLADLVENRIPQRLAERIDAGSPVERLDLRGQRYKLLLAFREDFLPHVEGWRRDMPSLMRNRLRLLPMSANQAMRVVLGETAHGRTHRLVDDATAAEIVRFVAAAQPHEGTGARATARRGSELVWDQYEVEPALLSLVASGLNERRKAAGQATIDAGLLRQTGAAIVGDFYVRCVADVSPATRRFIEDGLITEGGFRNGYPREDALAQGLISADELSRLIDRRLLRIEHQLGVDRIELIHDRLTEVVREQRDRERERRASRRLRLAGALGGAALLVLALVGAQFYRLWRGAEEANAQVAAALAEQSKAVQTAKQARHAAEQASLAASEAAGRAEDQRRIADAQRSAAEAATERASASLRQAEAAKDRETRAAQAARQATDETRTALRQAVAGRLLLQSRTILSGLRSGSLEEAAQLATVAYRMQPSDDALEALQAVLAAAPHLQRVLALPEAIGAMSPDGRTAVTGSGSKRLMDAFSGGSARLRLWDADTGKLLGAEMKDFDALPTLAVSPDGRLLATGHVKGLIEQTVRLWRLPAGEPHTPVLPLGAAITSSGGATFGYPALAFSADGLRLAAAHNDGTVRLIDVPVWKEDGRPLVGHAVRAEQLVFLSDGRLLSGAGDGGLRVWNADGSSTAYRVPPSPALPKAQEVMGRSKLSTMAFSANGTLLAAADDESRVLLWNTASGRLLASWTADGSSEIDALAFSHDGDLLLAGDDAGRLHVLDTPGLQPRRSPWRAHDGAVKSIHFRPGPVLVTTGADASIRRWSPAAWVARKPASAVRWDATPVRHLGAWTDFRRLVSSDVAGHWSIASADDGVPVVDGAVSDSRLFFARALPQTGQLLTLARDGRLLRRDATTGTQHGASVQLVGTFQLAELSFATASADGQRVALGGNDGSVWVLDATSGETLCSRAYAAGNRAVISRLAFSPDGRLLVAGSFGMARAWISDNCRSVGPVLPLGKMLSGRIGGIAVSNDGLVVAAADQAVVTWKAQAAEATLLVPKQAASLEAVALSRDGRMIAAGTRNGEVVFFEVASGRPIGAAQRIAPTQVTALAFNVDGTAVAWGDAAGNLGRADAPPAWMNRVCGLLARNLDDEVWRTLAPGTDYVIGCPSLPVR